MRKKLTTLAIGSALALGAFSGIGRPIHTCPTSGCDGGGYTNPVAAATVKVLRTVKVLDAPAHDTASEGTIRYSSNKIYS